MHRLLYEKKKELGDAADKLRNGLSKIDDTREKVQKMSVELEDAKTKVAQFQKQCDDYLLILVQQKRDADEQQKVSVHQDAPVLCILRFIYSILCIGEEFRAFMCKQLRVMSPKDLLNLWTFYRRLGNKKFHQIFVGLQKSHWKSLYFPDF